MKCYKTSHWWIGSIARTVFRKVKNQNLLYNKILFNMNRLPSTLSTIVFACPSLVILKMCNIKLFIMALLHWRTLVMRYSVIFKKKCSFYFLAFDFCWFCVVILFSSSATTANDLRLQRISIPDLIHYIYFPILIPEKEPVFSLLNVQC